MADKYVGAIVMEMDGREIEVVSVDPKVSTGRQAVMTMNSKGRALGTSKGVRKYDLSVVVAIPLDGDDIDWEDIEDARITICPENRTDKRTSYTGCGVVEVSEPYKLEGHAVRNLTMVALDKIKESPQ